MAETQAFDVVVIGGGPAGYVGAIRAGQLGLKVACIERDQLGGVCLNWGCIPTKALLAAAELYHRLKHDAVEFGIQADNIRHDWKQVIARSRKVTDNRGISFLFKKNKVTHIQGHARITAPGKIDVLDANGKTTQQVTAKNIVIATGAVPRELPFAKFDGTHIIAAKDAMNLPEQPKELIIIGAGAIGMEFAYFYNAFGTKVTVIEMLDRVVPNEDEEVSAAVAKAFQKQGIECLTSMKTTAVKTTDKGVEVTIEPADGKGEKKTLTGDKVLVAIGVKGRYDNLWADSVKIETFKDHIKVDRSTYQTSVKGIYAVGDVIGPPWLAHMASEEAVICIEQIAGHKPEPIDYDTIPGCTYCHPQIASVGKTEAALKKEGKQAGKDYTVGKFPFQASGKAKALGATDGFVKIIAGKKYGEILGVHMVGENVTELIAEMCLAKRAELTADEVINTIHAHPTLSESVHEAALGTQGRMLHF